MKLIPVLPHEFDAVYSEMENNFILEERRDKADALAVMTEPRFALYHMTEGEAHVGFVSVWQFEGFLFVEHLVTYKPYRKQGYGRKTLEALAKLGMPMVLEVEPPLTEFAKGRIEFYKKVGFCLNNYPYFQPPYRAGGEGVELLLMSYPTALDTPEEIKRTLYREVYRTNESQ